LEFFFSPGPQTANFNQVLITHLDDIIFYNLTFFGANMSCEHGKRKKLPGLLKKQYYISKNHEKPFQAPGADISAQNFKNS
jgi:hypothetical protein